MNNQNSILLIDPGFDPSTSVNCSLLVKVGINSFSYAILDSTTKKVIAVYDQQECEDVLNKFKERLTNDSYLSLDFSEIKIASHTENNITIPSAFYSTEKLGLTTKFFPNTQSGSLQTAEHPSFNFISVFSFSKTIDEIINQFLNNVKKYEFNAGLLKLAENLHHTSLIIDFTAGSMHIIYLRVNQIVFQKDHDIENTEEFNYYLLLIISQLAINLSETQIYLSGIVHVDDEKYNCLKQYFNMIEFINQTDQPILEDMPAHYYTSLLALDQCV